MRLLVEITEDEIYNIEWLKRNKFGKTKLPNAFKLFFEGWNFVGKYGCPECGHIYFMHRENNKILCLNCDYKGD